MQNSDELKTGPLSLQGVAGAVESYLEMPEASPRFAGLVCHPNPLQGGTYHNKVVTSLTRLCRRQSGAALRFNFRGVGGSEGQHEGGVGEAEDTCCLVDWLRARVAGPFWLAGFSFGSMVAARAAVELAARGTPVDQLLLVAPPVEMYVWPELSAAQCPVTIIQGEDDEVVDARAVIEFAEKQLPKPAIISLSDCGHFFHGRLRELMEAAQLSLP